MKRMLMSLLFLLLLAACGASAPAEPTERETAVPPANNSSSASDAVVEAIFPATTPAEASIVRDRDWTKGATEPVVTVIEYGDFQ